MEQKEIVSGMSIVGCATVWRLLSLRGRHNLLVYLFWTKKSTFMNWLSIKFSTKSEWHTIDLKMWVSG